MDQIDVKLDAAINEEFNELSRKTGKERILSAKSLENLLKIRKEREQMKFDQSMQETKLDYEEYDREKRLKFEKEKRYEDNFWKAINAGLEGFKTIAPLTLAVVMFKKVMTFEETGSIVSTVGGTLIPSVFRIKF